MLKPTGLRSPVLILAALVGCTANAHADACVDAINRFNASANAFNSRFGDTTLSTKSEEACRKTIATIEVMLPIIREQENLLATMRGICGSRAKDMFTGVNPAAAQRSKYTEIMQWCKEQLAKVEMSRTPSPSTAPPQTQSVSCSSTITGLGGDARAATNCRSGDAALSAARQLYRQDRAQARAKYQEAAEAYRRAGDINLANKTAQEMVSGPSSDPNVAAPPPSIINPGVEGAPRPPRKRAEAETCADKRAECLSSSEDEFDSCNSKGAGNCQYEKNKRDIACRASGWVCTDPKPTAEPDPFRTPSSPTKLPSSAEDVPPCNDPKTGKNNCP